MAAPLILARTFKDAHAYAQGKLGLTIGYYRVVNSPGTIKAVRGHELHLVPGWDKRPDRFSMRSAIRYCRNTVIDVSALEAAGETTDPRGDLTERQLKVAYRYNDLLNQAAYEAALPKVEITVVPDDTPVPEHHTEMIARVAPHLVTPDDVDEVTVAEEALAQVNQDDPAPEDKPSPTVVSPEAEALVAAAPKKRRRSKCKDCGNLHYKDEPCPTSESV